MIWNITIAFALNIIHTESQIIHQRDNKPSNHGKIRWSSIDPLVFIIYEERRNFFDVEEALQDSVHVACITKALKSLCFVILETHPRGGYTD